jgi:hypothetical protein
MYIVRELHVNSASSARNLEDEQTEKTVRFLSPPECLRRSVNSARANSSNSQRHSAPTSWGRARVRRSAQ